MPRQVIGKSTDGLPGLWGHIALEGLLALHAVRFQIIKKAFQLGVSISFQHRSPRIKAIMILYRIGQFRNVDKTTAIPLYPCQSINVLMAY